MGSAIAAAGLGLALYGSPLPEGDGLAIGRQDWEARSAHAGGVGKDRTLRVLSWVAVLIVYRIGDRGRSYDLAVVRRAINGIIRLKVDRSGDGKGCCCESEFGERIHSLFFFLFPGGAHLIVSICFVNAAFHASSGVHCQA